MASSSPPSSAVTIPLTPREAASGISGSISLACWLFLLLPQLLENYRNGNADAISLGFIFIWFLGDICNLTGALWAGLVPTVIAIAVYFCFADGILIGQVMYYRIKTKRTEGKGMLAAARESFSHPTSAPQENGPVGSAGTMRRSLDGETEPLLSRSRTVSSSITIPGSQRRRSSAVSHRRQSSAASGPLSKILEESDAHGGRLWLHNILSIVGVVAVGTLGWFIAYQSGVWKPTPMFDGNQDPDQAREPMAPGAQILGYASAVAYLGARIPQIIKNYRDQSCEGLSLLFFILSLLGNATYGAGIFFHSTERAYMLTNLPWLIGSLGTMFEDVTIFVQFHIYGNQNAEGDAEVAVM